MKQPQATATDQEALSAFEIWKTKFHAHLAQRPSTQRPGLIEELSRLLETHKKMILGELTVKGFGNPYSSKISLSDISQELKDFFRQQGAYVTRDVRDTLRHWFHSIFGDKVRVEGDSNDLYLDLA